MPKPETPSAIEIAREYFTRMRARDLGVVELFHDDAELIGLGTRRRGRSAILDFYRGIIGGARPAPRQIGPLLAEGDRVAAEILIELPGGTTVHALDLFETERAEVSDAVLSGLVGGTAVMVLPRDVGSSSPSAARHRRERRAALAIRTARV